MKELEIEKEIQLVQTCEACPEQYDAYYKEEKIGYLRLRWGRFTVESKSLNEIVYLYDFDRDSYKGSFDDEFERNFYLSMAKVALAPSCKYCLKESE